MITWSQVDEDVFHPSAIQRLINKLGGKCRIGREFHQDGGVHFHAFCVKESRFITRDPRKFDIEGYHPNILPIKRTPQRAWAYVAKDGNLVVDEIPEPPIGRTGKRIAADTEVWINLINASASADDMLNNALKADPKRTIFSFNNIISAAKYYFPTTNYTQYTPPTGLCYEFADNPEIPIWVDRYFIEDPTPDTIIPNSICEELISEPDSIPAGEGSGMAGSAASTATPSLDSFSSEECELSRYDRATGHPPKRLVLRPNQHRPKCLCLIGPTRLGKTLVARSFGRHSYFHGNWNINQYDPDALYNVFDDIKGQLDGFDFTSFMGAQSDISVTDKYHHKKTYANGKPAIYLSNKDPLTTRKGRESRDWLLGNCTIVYITSPICNIAREALESEAIDKALDALTSVH